MYILKLKTENEEKEIQFTTKEKAVKALNKYMDSDLWLSLSIEKKIEKTTPIEQAIESLELIASSTGSKSDFKILTDMFSEWKSTNKSNEHYQKYLELMSIVYPIIDNIENWNYYNETKERKKFHTIKLKNYIKNYAQLNCL